VLALGPAIFAMCTYSQLFLGNEFLRIPGNVERFSRCRRLGLRRAVRW
jgi:hypothetical protein